MQSHLAINMYILRSEMCHSQISVESLIASYNHEDYRRPHAMRINCVAGILAHVGTRSYATLVAVSI